MARRIERPKPPYAQIADALRAMILDGTIKPGATIPSEREIAEEWGVSRATATKAVAALKSQGLVESTVGIGTVVNDVDGPITWSPRDRYRNMQRTGRILADGESQVLHTDVVKAPDDVRDALRLGTGASAIRRSRITSVRGTPVELSTSWFDAHVEDTCPDLLKDVSIKQGTTAYVAAQLGVDASSVVETVRSALATDDEAAALGIEQPAAVLVTAQTIFDQYGEPIEHGVCTQSASHRSMYEYDL